MSQKKKLKRRLRKLEKRVLFAEFLAVLRHELFLLR